jgi:hypothetical protein
MTAQIMKPLPEFEADTLLQSPLFSPLHPVIDRLKGGGFPSLDLLNAELLASDPPITVQNGCAVRFVTQEHGKLAFEAQYEPRCYLTGEVQTRQSNWHDLLNALVWLTFPKTKAVINTRHYQALTSDSGFQNGSGRGAVRDTNTLFDESGVIIACACPELAGLLRGFRWKTLFWQRRVEVQTGMGFYLFGHGLYEKALQPYTGMTGQGLLLMVDPAFFCWSYIQQLAYLDEHLAEYLADPVHCCSTRELSPVPLLGVPGWAADNRCASYYDNTGYFRSGRRSVRLSC